MDAPDAPFDLNARRGPLARDAHAVGGRRQQTGEPSTACVALVTVQRVAAGTLPAEEILDSGRRLVLHLLRGCADCATAFRLAAGLPAVGRQEPPDRYEVPVAAGIRNALRIWRERQGPETPRPVRALDRERAMALIAEARQLRGDEPEVALELLDEALALEGLAATSGSTDDLACEIQAERGNLFRLLGRHAQAERAFQAALAAWSATSENLDALLFHLGDLYGSFLVDRRRFADADGLSVRLVSRFRQGGELARAGKLTLKRSIATAYAGDSGRALHLAYEALVFLRGTESLEHRLNAVQLIVAWNIQLGNVNEASECADLMRVQYQRHMGAIDRAKFLWLEARISDGIRRPTVADGLYRRAKAQFEQLGLPFQAALVGLDLAVRLVDGRRADEARELIATELVPTFRSIGIAREGLASLVLLERATEAATPEAALIHFVFERARALIAEARQLRRDEPEGALDLLDQALALARLAAASCPEGESRGDDLACEIHAERGNLYRLLGQHRQAELAFQAALSAWSETLGDPAALLHLGDLYGSFLVARRRFAEADALLVRLVGRFRQRGERAHAGKLTLKRAIATAYAGEPDRALQLAYEALVFLKETESLEHRLNALQLIVAWNIQLGNVKEASECADLMRAQYRRHMGAIDRAKFLWLDARIHDGTLRRNVAEGLFRRAKAQFERLGLPFQAALVGLDLAVMLVERRRAAEARELIATELVPTFRSIGIAREGLASLVLLERATEAATLDAALIRSVLRDLERAGPHPGPKPHEAEGAGFE